MNSFSGSLSSSTELCHEQFLWITQFVDFSSEWKIVEIASDPSPFMFDDLNPNGDRILSGSSLSSISCISCIQPRSIKACPLISMQKRSLFHVFHTAENLHPSLSSVYSTFDHHLHRQPFKLQYSRRTSASTRTAR